MPEKRPNIIFAKGLTEEPPKPPPSPWLGLFYLIITCALIVGVGYGILFILHKTAPAEVKIPEIVGLDQAAAEILLRKSGLEIGRVSQKPSEELDAGKIIECNPPVGQSVKKGRSVSLTVSSGTNWTDVPDIREMSERRARSILKDKELFIGQSRQAYSALPEGFIVAQIPAPGSRVPTNTYVEVVISRGPYTPPPPDPMEIVPPLNSQDAPKPEPQPEETAPSPLRD